MPVHGLSQHRESGSCCRGRTAHWPGRPGRPADQCAAVWARHAMAIRPGGASRRWRTMSTQGVPRAAGVVGSPSAVRRTGGSSLARHDGPTTCRCLGCCTWPSRAAPWPTRASAGADVSAALEQPGVVAAFTGGDLASGLRLAAHRVERQRRPHRPRSPAHREPRRRAISATRWPSSSPRAPIRPRTRSTAVQVDYDRLPAVIEHEAALADGAPLVHADKGTNHAFSWGFTAGDYEAVKAPRGGRRVAPVRPAAAHPDRDGAARGAGRPDAGHRRVHALDVDAGARTSCAS